MPYDLEVKTVSDAFASSPATIGSLLSFVTRERIVIPTFQRGYMWKKKHVEAFWSDLEKQRESSKQLGADQHFFGPIVTLAKPTDGIIEILDGQQRLATATILFSVLRDVARNVSKKTGTNAGHEFAAQIQFQFMKKQNGFFAITMGATDELYFKETIQNSEPANTRAKLFTHRNIKAARDFLTEKVEALTSGDSIQALAVLNEISQTLVSDFVMARIPVTSQESAFKIFTTLNDRGLRLSPPDLLLSYLMEKAPTDADRLTIRSMWTEMIQRMGTHDIDRFMRHMWVSKYGDLKKVDLFTALSKEIKDSKISSVDFARLCGDECDNYIQLLTVEKEHIPEKSLPLVRAITQELNFQPAFPLLLSSYQLLQPDDFWKVAGYILVFVTRYSIISNLDSGGMEDLLYRLARDVRTMVSSDSDKTGSQQATKHIKDVFIQNTPDDEAVKKKVVENSSIDAPDAKYVTMRLARYIQDPAKEIAPTLEETNLEHIYPQGPEETQWGGPDNQAKLEPLTWNLGNLTIFGKRANRKVANLEFPDKKPKYASSKVKMTSDVAAAYDHWDEHTIKERAAKLAKLVVEVWKFDNTSRV